MTKLQCEDCGLIDHVLFDGYNFGDTLLEGVMFEARLVGKDATGAPEYAIVVAKGHEAHWCKLNSEYWLAQAKEYIAGLDVAECPKCHDDVLMPGFDAPTEEDDEEEIEESDARAREALDLDNAEPVNGKHLREKA